MKDGNLISMTKEEQKLFDKIGCRVIDDAHAQIEKHQDKYPGMIQTAYLGAALSLYLCADIDKETIMNAVEELLDMMLA